MRRDELIARLKEAEPAIRARGAQALYQFESHARAEARADSEASTDINIGEEIAPMDSPDRPRAGPCEPLCSQAKYPRRVIQRVVGAFFLVFALAFGLAAARAQAPAKDLWQIYMQSALFSNQTQDFTVEELSLNAALAYAKQHDPHGQRQAAMRLPLILAYIELKKKDLYQPLIDQQQFWMIIDQLDDRISDYLYTLHDYGWSYYDRWKSLGVGPTDDRLFAARASFNREVALRQRFNPGDAIDLASAIGMVGLVYQRQQNFACADFEYGRQAQVFLDFQHGSDAMAMLGARFSVSKPATAAGEEQTPTAQAAKDTRIEMLLFAAYNLTALASKSLNPQTGPGQSSASKSSSTSQCDNFGPQTRNAPAVSFDAQVERASGYLDAVSGLIREMRKRWPSDPIIGWADYRAAGLYKLEFEARKLHPQHYPNSLEKARQAYDEALAILTHADGLQDEDVRDIAAQYADLLVKANLPNDAKLIKERYGVTPSK